MCARLNKRCCNRASYIIHLIILGALIALLGFLLKKMGNLQAKLSEFEATRSESDPEVVECTKDDQVLSGSGKGCRCKDSAQYLDLSGQNCTASCGANATVEEVSDIKKCICQTGYNVKTTNQTTAECVACFEGGLTFNNQCYTTCPTGTVAREESGECLCEKAGSINHNGKCICSAVQRLDGTCGDSCAKHEVSTVINGEKVCKCDEGFSKDEAGHCKCNTTIRDQQGSCLKSCEPPRILFDKEAGTNSVCRCKDAAMQVLEVDGKKKCVCPNFRNEIFGCVNECGARETAIMDPETGVINLCFCNKEFNTIDSSNQCIAKADIEASKTNRNVYIIIGVVGGAFLIIILVLTILVVRRRNNQGGIEYLNDLNQPKSEDQGGVYNSWATKAGPMNVNTFE